MRSAVVDLGTNTFDLIIVEKESAHNRFQIIYTDKSFVSLGQGGINEKRITKEAMDRAYFALEHFIQACTEENVAKVNIHAFGTSALRDANNTDEFLSFIKHHFDLDIKVIKGKEEARYIYEGIKGIHNFREESCIMDIGGGSTEFIFADKDGVHQIDSLNIGVSRILQRFDIPNQLTSSKIDEVKEFMNREAGNIFDTRNTSVLIGAAGSFETFYQLVTGKTTYDDFSTIEIPFESLKTHLKSLIKSGLTERNNNFRIPDYRKKMIHIAALQTLWVIEKQKIRRCYFSPAALKEGVIFSEV
jgi:exopolyphosphatase/guanosine-5'-triphosphate,3'-diphosphate pyrophosphatase